MFAGMVSTVTVACQYRYSFRLLTSAGRVYFKVKALLMQVSMCPGLLLTAVDMRLAESEVIVESVH
jgi:hypothetical protein